MKSALPITLVLFALLWSAAHAAKGPKVAPPPAKEKPSPQAAALKPESVIPKRELVFDQSEEEVGLQFPSPEILGPRVGEVAQQRYVAFLTLRFGIPMQEDPPRESRFDPEGEQAVQVHMRNLEEMFFGRSLKPTLLRSLAQIPRDRLPSGDLLKMVTADGEVHVLAIEAVPVEQPGSSSRFFAGPRPPAGERPSRKAVPSGERPSRKAVVVARKFTLVAAATDRAKQLAEAVLSAYDYGFSFPYHQQMVERLKYWEPMLVEERREAKKIEDELTACRKQLEDLNPWADIAAESLTNLTTQQRLIAVEEAGVKARIAACEKLLKKPYPPRRAEQAENAKTAAEIELVGLAAKRAAIEEIIEKGRKRIDLQASVSSLSARQRNEPVLLAAIERYVARYKESIDKKLPFAEVQGKIIIRRIRWEQPRSPAPGGLPGQRGSPAPRGPGK